MILITDLLINIILGIISGILTIIIIYLLKRCYEYIKISRNATIENGLKLKVGRCNVKINIGKIENINKYEKNAAVVLPANTSFIDDCIHDTNSALGSYFQKYYPEKIKNINKIIKKRLKKENYSTDINGNYEPGTSILLPDPYQVPVKIIITASTVRKLNVGIRAEPSFICKSIQEIFNLSADKKISKIFMPIIGTGHGGLDLYDGLIFLLLSIKHISRKYHHIKTIHIIVLKRDAEELKNLYRVQYLALIKKEYNGDI